MTTEIPAGIVEWVETAPDGSVVGHFRFCPPVVGTCWVCSEYADDWGPTPLWTYCMAGEMCFEHRFCDGVSMVTDPMEIEHAMRHMPNAGN